MSYLYTGNRKDWRPVKETLWSLRDNDIVYFHAWETLDGYLFAEDYNKPITISSKSFPSFIVRDIISNCRNLKAEYVNDFA